MKNKLRQLVVLTVVGIVTVSLLVGCNSGLNPSPLPTASPSTSAPTATVKPSPTSSPTATTPTVTLKPSPTPSPTATAKPQQISVVVASSPLGSGGNTLAQNFAQIASAVSNNTLKISVVPSPNALNMVLSGTGQIAIHSNTPTLYRLYNGLAEFKDKKNQDMRTLFPSVPISETWLALAESKPNSLYDLKGLTVASNLPGSTIEQLTNEFLTATGYDLSKDVKILKIAPGDIFNAVTDRRADVGILGQAHPSERFQEIEMAHPIKFLEIPAELVKKVNDQFYGGQNVYGSVIVQAGKYYKTFTKDVAQIALPTAVVCIKDMDESLAYTITKTFWEGKSQMDAQWVPGSQITKELIPVINSTQWPLHPGALKYYNEMGWKVQ